MRISTQQQFLNSIDNMQRTTANMAKLQEQLSTGERLTKPSDDPIAAAQVVKLDRELAQLEKFQANIDISRRRLDLEETILTDVNNVLDRMKELTIQGGNATLTDADRKTLATELRGLIDYAAGLMNTQDAQGEFIFSGSKGFTKPYEPNGVGSYSYQGDGGQRNIQVASNLNVPSTDSGEYLFEAVANRVQFETFGKNTALISNIEFPEPIEEREANFLAAIDGKGDLNLEIYVQAENPEEYAYRISDSAGNVLEDQPIGAPTEFPYTVEFNGLNFTLDQPGINNLEFETTPEVSGVQEVTLVDADLARQFEAQYGEIQIEFTPAGPTYRLLDENSNEITIDGATTFPYAPGDTLSFGGYEVKLGTPAAGDIYTIDPSSNGVPLTPVSNVTDIAINDLTNYLTYSDNGGTPISDVRVVFNTAVPEYELFEDGVSAGTFAFVNTPGTTFEVGGAGTTGIELTIGDLVDGEAISLNLDNEPSADITLKTTVEQLNLLDVAAELADALEVEQTPQTREELTEALATALDDFNTAQERNIEARTSIGTRLNMLERTESSNADFKIFTETVLSSIVDLDFAEAISELKLEEVTLQAAQATFAKVQNLSLFDYIN